MEKLSNNKSVIMGCSMHSIALSLHCGVSTSASTNSVLVRWPRYGRCGGNGLSWYLCVLTYVLIYRLSFTASFSLTIKAVHKLFFYLSSCVRLKECSGTESEAGEKCNLRMIQKTKLRPGRRRHGTAHLAEDMEINPVWWCFPVEISQVK